MFDKIAYMKKYNHEHIEERKKYNQEHMKEYLKKYRQEHKEERKEWLKEYLKKYFKEYRQTPNGRDIIKRGLARRRNLGCEILFENIFDGEVVGHHISDGFIFYIPQEIHKNNLGKDHRDLLKPFVEKMYDISYIID